MLRELNERLSESDSLLFTHPLQPWAFEQATCGWKGAAHSILQVHGDYFKLYPELGQLLEQSRSMIDDLQIVSRGLGADLSRHVPSDRIHWIPNIHEPAAVGRIDSERVTIALVGSFQDTKNQLDAVRMMQRLTDLDVTLHLWGNHANAYGRYVRQFVEKHFLTDRIELKGVGSERQIYQSADIVIMPSRSEGFGYSLVEAASQGVPVVAYDYDFGPRGRDPGRGVRFHRPSRRCRRPRLESEIARNRHRSSRPARCRCGSGLRRGVPARDRRPPIPKTPRRANFGHSVALRVVRGGR